MGRYRHVEPECQSLILYGSDMKTGEVEEKGFAKASSVIFWLAKAKRLPYTNASFWRTDQ